MHATSSLQFDATNNNTLPDLENVRAGIWALPLDMPDDHIPFSLCYLFVDDQGDVDVVDPGWDSDENWQRLLDALITIGAGVARVRTVTATHLHPDHLGLAERLRAASGAQVSLHRAEQAALDALQPDLVHSPVAFTADRLLDDDQVITLGGRTARVIRTPGHTNGHICLELAVDLILITGDHVLPTIYSGLGLGGSTESNPMADYLDALDVVSVFDDHEVLPGHGYRFRGLAERCADLAEHHLRRAREVNAIVVADADASLEQIASQITWSAGWENLHGFYRDSALAQTAMHRAFVRTDSGRARLATH